MNEITLTCDMIVHLNGYRLTIPEAFTAVPPRAPRPLTASYGELTDSELDTLEKSSGDDCDMTLVECVVRELREWRDGTRFDRTLKAAEAAIEDLNVQCKFWRQAAEHAVKGWNELEEKVEAAREALDAIESNSTAARELLGAALDDCPPDIVKAIDDAISGTKLRIVEEETPFRPRPGFVQSCEDFNSQEMKTHAEAVEALNCELSGPTKRGD